MISNMQKLTQERRDERRSRHPSVQQGQIPAVGSASAGDCEGCSCHRLDGVIRNSGWWNKAWRTSPARAAAHGVSALIPGARGSILRSAHQAKEATFVLWDAIKPPCCCRVVRCKERRCSAGACAAAGGWGPLQLKFVPTQTSLGEEHPHNPFLQPYSSCRCITIYVFLQKKKDF